MRKNKRKQEPIFSALEEIDTELTPVSNESQPTIINVDKPSEDIPVNISDANYKLKRIIKT